VTGTSALARRVLRATLRQWAACSGYEGRHPVGVVALATLLILGASMMAATLLAGDTLDVGATTLASGVLATLVVLASFGALFSQSLEATRGSLGRCLSLLPVSNSLLVALLTVPVLGLVSGLALVVAIPFAGVLAQASAGGAVTVIVAMAAAVACGGLQGTVLWFVARRITAPLHRLRGHTYTVALALWGTVAAANMARADDLLGRPGDPLAGIGPLDWMLAWPLVSRYLTEPSAAAGAAVGALAVGLALLAVVVARPAAIHGLLRDPLPRRPPMTWRASPPGPLVRLELVRLLRTGRIASSYVSTLALTIVAVAATAVVERSSRLTVGGLFALLIGVSLAQIPLMARGTGARHRPAPLRLGFEPAAWSSAMVAAALLLAASVAVPGMVVLAALTGEPGLFLAFAIGFQLPALVGGALLGSTLTPGPDSSGVQVAALGLLTVALMGVLGSISQAVASDLAAAAIVAALSLPLLSVPGVVERRRWQRDTRHPLSPPGGAR
jgi:hypothetical protein